MCRPLPQPSAVVFLFLAAVSGRLLLGPTSLQAQTRPAGTFSQVWARLSGELRDTLEAQGMVGAAWVFVRDGQALGWETFGYADLETGRRVDSATIFHWGSVTKTLTGVAMMQLRDRGLLGLDDPIVRYVPELRQVYNPYGPMEAVTVRHLLSHTGGFRGPTWPWGGDQPWHPHEPTRWEQLVAMMPYTEILFPPGSRYSYSNPGIVFAAQALERLVGEEWEVYVEKNLLRPLGMHRSYFDLTPRHLLGDRSNNYTVRNGVPIPNGLDFDTGITVSNGGLNAPLGDMIRYLAFLTDAGDPKARALYRQVLDRSSLEEMWREQATVSESPPLREAMGITFFLLDHGGRRYIGHTGSQKAFQAFLYFDPVARTGALAAFNSTGEGPQGRPATRAILNWLRERMFAEIFPLFR